MSTSSLVFNVLIVAWILYLLINGDLVDYIKMVRKGALTDTVSAV